MKKLLATACIAGLAALSAVTSAHAGIEFYRDYDGNATFYIDGNTYYGTRRSCNGNIGAGYDRLMSLRGRGTNYSVNYCHDNIYELCLAGHRGTGCSAISG